MVYNDEFYKNILDKTKELPIDRNWHINLDKLTVKEGHKKIVTSIYTRFHEFDKEFQILQSVYPSLIKWQKEHLGIVLNVVNKKDLGTFIYASNNLYGFCAHKIATTIYEKKLLNTQDIGHQKTAHEKIILHELLKSSVYDIDYVEVKTFFESKALFFKKKYQPLKIFKMVK